jgi:hypothetical protein
MAKETTNGEKAIIALGCCVAFLLLPYWLIVLSTIGCVTYLAVRWIVSPRAKAAPHSPQTAQDYWQSLPGVQPPHAPTQSIWKRIVQRYQ